MAFGVRRSVVGPLWFPLTLLLVGVAATTIVTLEVADAVETQDSDRFAAAADQLQARIVERLDTYIAMLRAGAGALSGSAIPAPQDFRAFVERLELDRRYPGIQGIGFSVRVTADALPALLAERQRAGDPGFHVWPEGPRPEYHSIIYLEPLDRRNSAAIGYDMFTDPIRRDAMERARDSGEPAASGAVTLVQEIDEDKQPGFLIYMPVYEGGGVPLALDERRGRLRGFVYSPFRATDLFEGILGRDEDWRAGFELFDGMPPAVRLHRTDTGPDTGRFSTTRVIAVAGRQWAASVFSLPALDESSSRGLVRYVAWGGGLITLLLTGLAWTQARAREQAEASEAVAAAASRSLQAQTATLEVINRTGAQLAGELDLELLVQAVTDAATRLTRAQFGAFFYRTENAGRDAYTLQALSGVPREAFEDPATHEASIVRPTFRAERIIRSDDITAEPREDGEPPLGVADGRLAVRSYMAAPVRSRSGELLGGLVFGHAAPGVFTEQAEEIVAGIAAQAAVAVDNARLYRQVQTLLASERAARAEAERVSSLKDEFLATLSHELRTPLNAVIGWAHMLGAGRLGDEKRRIAIDAILRNARAQSHLVEDLLDMSRIISGRLHMEMKDVDLREVLRAAMDVVHPTATAKRVQITLDAGEDAPIVRGDADRLQQVVWNLLTNAIKFTPAGGRVDVALRTSGEQVEIVVVDTGIGIHPEFAPFVFERFRQADGSVTRDHGGLGLGLSIVRSLVEMHAGDVRVASEGPDRGSTFIVRLPRAAGARPAGARSDPRALDAALYPDILRGINVLVVDDDADGRTLASEILEQHGAEVRTAPSASQALRLLQSGARPPDVLISDLGMPQVDGYELIRRVRSLPAASGSMVRAIALTAYATASDRRKAIAAGFDLHVSKPFTPDQLVAACLSLTRA